MSIGADGMKTGFTKDGGYGLVGSAVQNGLRLIVVVNGLKTAKERADEAQEAARMGLQGFRAELLFAEGQTVGDAKVYGGAHWTVPLRRRAASTCWCRKARNERIIARDRLHRPVRAPVQEGPARSAS